MRWLEACALLALIFLLVEAGLLLREVRGQFTRNAQQVMQTLTDADRTVVIIAGVATNIEKSSRTWQTKQNQIADASQKALSTLNSDLVSLNSSLAAVSSLSNSLAQSSNSALNTATASVKTMEQSVVSLQPPALEAIQNLDQASAALSRTLADPAIQKSLANIETTSQNVAGTTAEMDGSAKDIHAWIHRETAPVRGTWHVIKGFLVSFAGPAAQVVTAAKP